MISWLKKNKIHNVKYLNEKVFVRFAIEADGILSEIENLRDFGHATREKAVRVLKLSPN